MGLTATSIKNAKPGAKPLKLFDGGGLFLLVVPSGGKWWRLKYRFDGKEKLLSLGVFPEIGLKDARDRRDEARKALANGFDPSAQRKAVKASRLERGANSFEVVAREWIAKRTPSWAASHASKVAARLEKDAYAWIGGRPVAELKATDVLSVIRRVEERGALDTAHRVLENCGQVMRYAIATGRATHNPCGDLRGALPPSQHVHFPSIIDPARIGELLRAIEGFRGTFVVQCALRLAPLFFVRPGELRKASWADFDLDKAEWRYLVTKTKTEHLVPLSTQAVAILKDLHPLTGHRPYVFPGRDPRKGMSEAAVNAALRRMGYDTKTEITGHGFRAMARTILQEELGASPFVIEHQLAHRVPDTLGAAYNRTKFLKERRVMMQQWADYLDALRTTPAN